ncbi:MAG: Ku protein [Gammaproteobacteria bacterium]|nr:Ku protein [Gammaproteobacteria bacterium]MBV9620990.1 Ku protein [Gammaproteobacteria bacterium]
MARAVWKGAVTFGLVHLPVALYPATEETGIGFEWLDRRSLDPVGYKRYNKRTGRELKPQDIVKGVKQPGGRYVVVSDEEIRAAYPKRTQTIEIESFAPAAEVPPYTFQKPYYVEPTGRAEKVYGLLRDTMRNAEVIAIARLVMHSKEHLAALMSSESLLLLVTLRWQAELRTPRALGLETPAGGQVKPEERKMAAQLVASMTHPWRPAAYAEHFTAAIHALIRRKASAGKARPVQPLEEYTAPAETNIVDLRQLLADSMRRGKRAAGGSAARAGRARRSA